MKLDSKQLFKIPDRLNTYYCSSPLSKTYKNNGMHFGKHFENASNVPVAVKHKLSIIYMYKPVSD